MLVTENCLVIKAGPPVCVYSRAVELTRYHFKELIAILKN